MAQTHDTRGRAYAKLSELKPGVYQADDGLYLLCARGRHYLSGQADDGEHCVGVYKALAP